MLQADGLERVRLRIEREEMRLSPLAAKSAFSHGRLLPESPSATRTAYQRDRDRVVHCNAFRRLKHKTQVFVAPLGDHYVTRLTHTLQVAQIARSIARALNLNEDLAEAISYAHDLGHTPFGHAGESTLDEIHPGGFQHSQQSLRVVDRLEAEGLGLNLTWETRDGVQCHSKDRSSVNDQSLGVASTLEGQIVKLADGVAYLSHDVRDAIRARIIEEGDIPESTKSVLGSTSSSRINAMVNDIIEASWDLVRADESSVGQTAEQHRQAMAIIADSCAVGSPLVRMSPGVLEATDCLRSFLFDTVYTSKESYSDSRKAANVVARLYSYYVENWQELPSQFLSIAREESVERAVCDYVSGMTDRYALREYTRLFMPRLWSEEV